MTSAKSHKAQKLCDDGLEPHFLPKTNILPLLFQACVSKKINIFLTGPVYWDIQESHFI